MTKDKEGLRNSKDLKSTGKKMLKESHRTGENSLVSIGQLREKHGIKGSTNTSKRDPLMVIECGVNNLQNK